MEHSADLVLDVGTSFEDAKKNATLIIQGYVAAHPVVIQMELHIGERILLTRKVYMRKHKPDVIDGLVDTDIYDLYLATVNFDRPEDFVVKLYLTKLLSSQGMCPKCNKVMRANIITRHLKTCATDNYCPICQTTIEGDLKAHIELCNRVDYPCRVCGESFNTGARRTAHEKKCRTYSNPLPNKRLKPNDNTAIGGIFKIVKVDIPSYNPDYEGALLDKVEHVEDVLRSRMETGLKFYISLKLLAKPLVGEETKIINFQTSASTLLQSSNYQEEIKKHIEAMVMKVEKYSREGSGWVIDVVKSLHVMMSKYNPTAGSTYFSLPDPLKKKRSLLNIQNSDDKCLLWCILAALYPASDHSNEVYKYLPYETSLHMDGIVYPVSIHQIPKVERQNNLSINVYTWDKEDGFYPLYVSDRVGVTIDLLLLGNEKVQHYILVKSLSGLLSQRTKYNGRMFYCRRCLHGFKSEKSLKIHQEDCSKFKVQRIEMPSKDKTHLEFDSFRKMVKHPVFVVADFESIVEKVDAPATQTGEVSSTTKTTVHKPCAYALKVCSHLEDWDLPVEHYRGSDAAHTFVLRLHELFEELSPIIFAEESMKPVSDEKKVELEQQRECYLCQKTFTTNDKKHLDHCHYTGEVLAYTHPYCNQQRQTQKVLYVVIHNFKGYDCHLLINDLCKLEDDLWQVQLIPKTMEKYTSVMTERFRFIDSCQHLSASIDTLVSNLKDCGDMDKNFKPVKEYVDLEWAGDTKKFDLLIRKGVFPYSYLDDEVKFNEGLPRQEDFYNDLDDEACSDVDYTHVCNMWEEFNIRNLGHLCDIYVISDVLLLASIFTKYREECVANFQLDPLHYYTAPGLTWDACLKMTKVRLELLKDVDMYTFCERAIRGGVSVISKRHSIANNQHLPNFNPMKPSTYLWYIDANNLYGWSMVQKQPISNFSWGNTDAWTTETILKYDETGDIGHFLEVNIEIPEHLHDKFNDYPIMPEPLEINHEMVSPISLEIRRKRCLNNDTGDIKFSSTKLAPNLFPKEKYICHIRNLKFYLEQGVVLTNIHRILTFKQDNWIQPYIMYNTRKRQQATNDFQKAFHKLLNNAFFGKTMESVRKRINVVLVENEKRANFQISKPGFKRFEKFSEDLVGVELVKPVVELNKPVFVGAAILDLSKLLMFKFHYEVIKVKYPTALLCFTDTDSLLYEIPTDNLFEDMRDFRQHLDLSNYHPNHELYSTENKAVLGKFKDECEGLVMKEFIGLRSKMYSIDLHLSEDQKRWSIERVACGQKGLKSHKLTAAGVKKKVAKRHLTHEMYRNALYEQSDTYITQKILRSYKHVISNVTQCRVGLTAYDDKRYILEDGITTRAYGHCDINKSLDCLINFLDQE